MREWLVESAAGRSSPRSFWCAALFLVPAFLLVVLAAHASASFVAVGPTGTITTSPDGAAWTPHTSGTAQHLYDVVHDGSQWVAVGSYQTVLTSPTGVAWTQQTSAQAYNAGSLTFDGVDWDGTQFVTVGDNGLTLTSPNGIAWSQSTNTVQLGAFFIGVHGSGGLWVAVGEGNLGGSNGLVKTSPDGVNWLPQPNRPLQLHSVTNMGAQWVIVGNTGNLFTSPDGTSWTQQASGTTQWLNGVANDGTKYVVVGAAGTILTSTNGVNWTPQTSGTMANLLDVAFDGCHWVAVGGSGANQGVILTSPNAVAWTAQSTTVQLRGVAGAIPNQPCPPPVCSPGSQSVLVGQTATLTASGGAPPYSWTAPSSTNPGPVATGSFSTSYNTAGTYTVSLTSAAIPAQSTSCTVTVNNPPPTTCSPASQSVLVGATASITAGSGVAPYTWAATSGTPSSASGASFSTTYATAGTYTVTASDSGPPVQNANCTVVVNNPPPTTCSPAALGVIVGNIAYLDAAQGVAPYTWNAPSGTPTSGTGASFQVTYAAAGTYTVTVADSGPPVQSATCTVTVTDPPLLCVLDTPGVTVGTPAHATASGGSGTYAWTAADGDPDAGAGSDFATLMSGLGPHAMTVTSGPQSATCNVTIVQAPPPPPPPPKTYEAPPAEPPVPGSAAPTSSPKADRAAPCGDHRVTFDGTASSDPDGSVLSWSWAFGDGAFASGPVVSHEYATFGPFTATLTVRDDDGIMSSKPLDVKVISCSPLAMSADPLTAQPDKASQACAHATGGQGGAQTFSAESLPAGATFDPSTGCVSWQPAATQTGLECLRITVHEGASAASACMKASVVRPADPIAEKSPQLKPETIPGPVQSIQPDKAPEATRPADPAPAASASASPSLLPLLIVVGCTAAAAFVGGLLLARRRSNRRHDLVPAG